MRHAICAAALLAAVVAASSSAASAAARPTLSCKSADLRYPFMPGGPKTFGVFKLRIAGGGCKSAHRVAKAWMKRFEANIAAGHVKLPRSVAGFAFKTLDATEAQSYRELGRRRKTSIRFTYRVPNG